MTHRNHLETALSKLAASVDWPDASPHLPTRVTARIEAVQAQRWQPVWRRLVIALSIVSIVVGVLVFSPSARQAVANLFSTAGIRIDFTTDPPPATGAELDLGERINLADIAQQLDFVLRHPAGEEPGQPSEVYLTRDGQVNMVWEGSQTLPVAGDTGVALLLTQSNAGNGPSFAYKTISPNTEVQIVMVEGVPGLWIEGAPHTITLLDSEANPVDVSTRLAANVLLWEANGINYRLETPGDLPSVLGFVDSLEPVP